MVPFALLLGLGCREPAGSPTPDSDPRTETGPPPDTGPETETTPETARSETGPESGTTETETETDTHTDTEPPECDPVVFSVLRAFDAGELGSPPIGDRPIEQGPGVALIDLDGDGALDVAYAVRSQPIRILWNDGVGGLALDPRLDLPEANGVAGADLDGDGDGDLVAATPAGAPELILWGAPDRSLSAEALPGPSGEGVTPTVADLDGDGTLDLFIAAYAHQFDPDKTPFGDGNGLWLAQGDGTWADRSASLPDAGREAPCFHGTPWDPDRDGDLDLYVSNDCFPGSACVHAPTMLYNDGLGRFTHDPTADDPFSAMGAATGDVDADGWPDAYVSNFGSARLFLNLHDGTFADGAAALGFVPATPASWIGWGAAWADLDRDGRDELIATFGPTDPEADLGALTDQPIAWFVEEPGVGWSDVGAASGWTQAGQGRSVTIGDLTGDGRPEVVFAEWHELTIWSVDGGCPFGLRITLDAGRGNPHGLGAEVTVLADTARTRPMIPSTTFSSSEPALYAGLGRSDKATIEVRWPDGTSTTHPDVAAGAAHFSQP